MNQEHLLVKENKKKMYKIVIIHNDFDEQYKEDVKI